MKTIHRIRKLFVTTLFLRLTIAAAFALSIAFILPSSPPHAAAPHAERPAIELVETAPIETSLDSPDLREAHEVWVEMIDGAERSLAFEHFYASSEPGSRLETVIAAIERAAGRGVTVRFVLDRQFAELYGETIERLDDIEGVEARILDTRALMGGVQHAKFFIVDGREIFVGSQNFDWRALEHIMELGVRVASEPVAREFLAIFDIDWAAARPAAQIEGEDEDDSNAGADASRIAVLKRDADWTDVTIRTGDDSVRVRPALSPQGHLSDESMWDLPQIVALIDSAKTSVRVQLLTYKANTRDKRYWPMLDGALRDAAARGVKVELLVSHWCQRRGTIEGLKSLQALPNLEVRILTPPEWSGGFIPFARVIHSKYLVADGARCWIGTSNWERGYFYTSRNMGLVIEGTAIAGRLDRYFENGWTSSYAETVDLAREYPAPRVSE
ncbi:MAG: phospholipase [Gemmatimonadetes bacterium]|nr:phospholipase [Gemmatimonadota bacterium]